MKRVLNILATISLGTTTASVVTGCGSNPTEVQQLYNDLNNKTLNIQDSKFWGNELNYQQDLLKDIESSAKIPPQDDSLLRLDSSDLQPFTHPGQYYVVVLIGKGLDVIQKAKVDVNWQLTKDQQDIYPLYKWWPVITSSNTYNNSIETLDNLHLFEDLNLFNGSKKDYGWDLGKVNQVKQLSLNNIVFRNDLDLFWLTAQIDQAEDNGTIPNLSFNYTGDFFKQHLIVANTLLNVGQQVVLPQNAFMIKNNTAEFPLLYYPQNPLLSPIPPKGQAWSAYYQNTYNLIQNNMRQTLKSGCTVNNPLEIDLSHILPDKGKYYVGWKNDTPAMQANTFEIQDELSSLFFDLPSFDSINWEDITYDGDLTPSQIPYDHGNYLYSHQIELYYKGVDQGISFPVATNPEY